MLSCRVEKILDLRTTNAERLGEFCPDSLFVKRNPRFCRDVHLVSLALRYVNGGQVALVVNLKRLVIAIVGDLDYDGHVRHMNLGEKDPLTILRLRRHDSDGMLCKRHAHARS